MCDVAYNNVNNWLWTPFIERHNANRIYIEIKFSMRDCNLFPGKRRSFNLVAIKYACPPVRYVSRPLSTTIHYVDLSDGYKLSSITVDYRDENIEYRQTDGLLITCASLRGSQVGITLQTKQSEEFLHQQEQIKSITQLMNSFRIQFFVHWSHRSIKHVDMPLAVRG